MSPNNEAVRSGEYGIIDDITCLDHWPELKYWDKPGRKCLIVDDIGWGLSNHLYDQSMVQLLLGRWLLMLRKSGPSLPVCTSSGMHTTAYNQQQLLRVSAGDVQML